MSILDRLKKNKQDPHPFLAEDDRDDRLFDDEPKKPRRTHTIVLYKAKDGWRWRLVAPNGKVTAESGEAYIRRYDCRMAAWNLATTALNAKVQED